MTVNNPNRPFGKLAREPNLATAFPQVHDAALPEEVKDRLRTAVLSQKFMVVVAHAEGDGDKINVYHFRSGGFNPDWRGRLLEELHKQFMSIVIDDMTKAAIRAYVQQVMDEILRPTEASQNGVEDLPPASDVEADEL